MSFTKEGVTYPTGADVSDPIGMSFPLTQFDVAGSTFVWNVLSVAITETLVPLGGLTSPHWAFFWNLDDENFLKLRPASSAASTIKLYPGEACPVALDTAITALYAIADTAAVMMRYGILPL